MKVSTSHDRIANKSGLILFTVPLTFQRKKQHLEAEIRLPNAVNKYNPIVARELSSEISQRLQLLQALLGR